jgi:hypothetical protein
MSLTVEGAVCAPTPDINKTNPVANKMRLRTRKTNAVVMLPPVNKKVDFKWGPS